MYVITIYQPGRETDRRTDGQADIRHSHSNIALREYVLRAVKMVFLFKPKINAGI